MNGQQRGAERNIPRAVIFVELHTAFYSAFTETAFGCLPSQDRRAALFASVELKRRRTVPGLNYQEARHVSCQL